MVFKMTSKKVLERKLGTFTFSSSGKITPKLYWAFHIQALLPGHKLWPKAHHHNQISMFPPKESST